MIYQTVSCDSLWRTVGDTGRLSLQKGASWLKRARDRVQWPYVSVSPLLTGGGVGGLWTLPKEILFEFSNKMRVCAFLLRKTTYGQKPGPGKGLNRPPGNWRCKTHGGWKFSKGFNSPTTSTRTCSSDFSGDFKASIKWTAQLHPERLKPGGNTDQWSRPSKNCNTLKCRLILH